MTIKDALQLTLGIIGTALVFLMMFLVIASIIHESGHALAAMTLGIQFNELEFGWYGIGPGVTVPEYVSREFLTIFRFAGGLTSGSILLTGYIIYSVWQRRVFVEVLWWSKFRWWFSYCLSSPGTYEMFRGYYEGTQYDKYVAGIVPSEYHLWIAIIVPFMFHVILTLLLVRHARLKKT